MRSAYLALFLLAISLHAAVYTAGAPVSPSSTIHVPGDYSDLQEAIDNAEPGSTIYVDSGVYTGSYLIEGKNGLTIVFNSSATSVNVSDTAFSIKSSSDIAIRGAVFHVNGSSRPPRVIYVWNTSGVELSQLTVYDADCFIRVYESSNVEVAGIAAYDTYTVAEIGASSGVEIGWISINMTQPAPWSPAISLMRVNDIVVSNIYGYIDHGYGVVAQRVRNLSMRNIVFDGIIGKAIHIYRGDNISINNVRAWPIGGGLGRGVYLYNTSNVFLRNIFVANTSGLSGFGVGLVETVNATVDRVITYRGTVGLYIYRAENVTASTMLTYDEGFGGLMIGESRNVSVELAQINAGDDGNLQAAVVFDSSMINLSHIYILGEGGESVHGTGLGVWNTSHIDMYYIYVVNVIRGIVVSLTNNSRLDTVYVANATGDAVKYINTVWAGIESIYIDNASRGLVLERANHTEASIIIVNNTGTAVYAEGLRHMELGTAYIYDSEVGLLLNNTMYTWMEDILVARNPVNTSTGPGNLGIYMYRASYATLDGFYVAGYWNGVHMWRSSNVELRDGGAAFNDHHGLVSWLSSDIYMNGVYAVENNAGAHVYGSTGVYIDGFFINTYTDIIIDSSDTVMATGVIHGARYGVYVGRSSNVYLSGNITGCRNGVFILFSSNIEIKRAVFSNNTVAMVAVLSNSVYVYLSMFTGNTYDLASVLATIQPYSPYPIHYTYGNYTGYSHLGNYWDKQENRVDTDMNGISDNPYRSGTWTDRYPLMDESWMYIEESYI